MQTPRLTIDVPAAGRRERRKAWTRQELLLAGRRLFSKKGLYESRIEDLTRHAGIAKGTLYQYFQDKDELVQAVVAVGFAELERCVQRRVRGSTSLPDLVERVVEAHFAFFAENPDLMRVFHQVRGLLKFNHRRWEPLRATLRQHLLHIAEWIAQAPSAVKPSQARRWEMAVLLFGAVSGIASVRATVEPTTRLKARPAMARGLTAMVLAGGVPVALPAARTPRRQPVPARRRPNTGLRRPQAVPGRRRP